QKDRNEERGRENFESNVAMPADFPSEYSHECCGHHQPGATHKLIRFVAAQVEVKWIERQQRFNVAIGKLAVSHATGKKEPRQGDHCSNQTCQQNCGSVPAPVKHREGRKGKKHERKIKGIDIYGQGAKCGGGNPSLFEQQVSDPQEQSNRKRRVRLNGVQYSRSAQRSL